MSRRVFLHVGSPKTGTTYLQAVLWRERDRLKEAGLLLPGGSIQAHFLGTLDVLQTPERASQPERVEGAWQRLADLAADWAGDVLVSHEHLARASTEQAERAIAAFIAQGREVHVVLTARDLARQLPAEWQERLKHRANNDFATYMASIQDPATGTYPHLWAVQDYAGVLRRWSWSLDAQRRHVVTVPPSGSASTLLWERFAAVLGLDPAAYDTDVPRSNSSLGREQAEVLRQVNLRLEGRLPLPGPYTGMVKGLLAQTVLEARGGTRLVLGGEDLAFARARSTQLVAEIEELGAQVSGDLADLLVPERPDDPSVSTGRLDMDPQQLLEETLTAVVDILEEVGRRNEAWRRQRGGLMRELRELRRETGGSVRPARLRRLLRRVGGGRG